MRGRGRVHDLTSTSNVAETKGVMVLSLGHVASLWEGGSDAVRGVDYGSNLTGSPLYCSWVLGWQWKSLI